MEAMLARASVSISELKRNPSAIIEEAGGEPVAVLNHNKPAAYLVPAAAWEALVEYLDDLELAKLIEERKGEPTVKVRLDDL